MKTAKIYQKGFMFVDGELKTFEPKMWRVCFSEDEPKVECDCILGKEKKTIDATDIVVYPNEDYFKASIPAKPTEKSLSELFTRAYTIYLHEDGNGRPCAWAFRDGEAKHVPVSHIEFESEDGYAWHSLDDEPLYGSSHDVYLANDYFVDGVKRVSPKSRLSLTDEQRKAVDKLESALEEMRKLGVVAFHNRGTGEMYFANKSDIDDWSTCESYDDSIIADKILHKCVAQVITQFDSYCDERINIVLKDIANESNCN